MEEEYVYIPKQYFYLLLIIFSIIMAFLLLDLYILGIKFYDLVILISLFLIFAIVIVFSYLSYKGKIPYLVKYENNLYASKYQLILTIIIFGLLFISLLPVYYFERGLESIISIALIAAISLMSIIFVYLSYKKKIPLLRLKL
ncbi:MAG: hypothetical protein QW184_00405 [Nanopusillaceae archaeon]